MKMNYRQKNSSAKKYFIIGSVLFFVLILLRVLFYSAFSSLAYTVAKPFWDLGRGIYKQTESSISYGDSKIDLVEKNKNLENKIYELEIKNLELSSKASVTENTEERSKPGFVISKILVKPPYSPFDIFIIENTPNSGISVGDKVYIGENTLIGEVVSILPKEARVQLLSSGSQSYQASIQRTGETVTLNGQGGGNFKVSVPKEFNVSLGDYLVDSSSKESVIAVVYSIDTSSQGSFKDVYARIPLNILQTEWVSVLTQ
jgi:cell shape-determining protein MreC